MMNAERRGVIEEREIGVTTKRSRLLQVQGGNIALRDLQIARPETQPHAFEAHR